MSDKEKRKYHLIIFPFCAFLGTIIWSFIATTSLGELLTDTFGILALYYFFYHIYEIYFENK